MSCGDSNTCAQGTVHTQGSSLSCDTASQFSAKRHQKKDCSVFLIGWNPRKTSAAIAPAAASTSRVQRKHPQDSKKKRGEAEGRAPSRSPSEHTARAGLLSQGPWKNVCNCPQIPTKVFACNCMLVCDVSMQRVSHSPFCHSQHKTSLFSNFVRMWGWRGCKFPNRDCCLHQLARKTAGTDSALHSCSKRCIREVTPK